MTERNGRYLVLSAETDAAGALAMSNRVAQAAHSQLGTTLVVGIASFPDDGQSFRDLLTVASDRCSSSFESTTRARRPGRRSGVASDGRAAPGGPSMSATIDLGAPDSAALDRCAWLARYPVRCSDSHAYAASKRAIDVALASIVLVMTLPLLILAALAIKIESPKGPVVFVQTRAGRCGRGFRLYKLRTMVPDASARKQELLHLNSRAWPDFKIEHDPRVLKVGRILRATSIDELPQLFNVLRGSMTLVGPRPTSLVADGFEHWQRERFAVKPGLTGVWQISGRDEPSLECRSRLDIAYVTRRSIGLDVRHPLQDGPGGRARARRVLMSDRATTDFASHAKRRAWFIGLQAVLVLCGVALVLGVRDETTYSRTTHLVLHPDSSVPPAQVPQAIDVLDGSLVQTVLRVLNSGAMLDQSAAAGHVASVDGISLDATVQPGSAYFDATIRGDDRHPCRRSQPRVHGCRVAIRRPDLLGLRPGVAGHECCHRTLVSTVASGRDVELAPGRVARGRPRLRRVGRTSTALRRPRFFERPQLPRARRARPRRSPSTPMPNRRGRRLARARRQRRRRSVRRERPRSAARRAPPVPRNPMRPRTAIRVPPSPSRPGAFAEAADDLGPAKPAPAAAPAAESTREKRPRTAATLPNVVEAPQYAGNGSSNGHKPDVVPSDTGTPADSASEQPAP